MFLKERPTSVSTKPKVGIILSPACCLQWRQKNLLRTELFPLPERLPGPPFREECIRAAKIRVRNLAYGLVVWKFTRVQLQKVLVVKVPPAKGALNRLLDLALVRGAAIPLPGGGKEESAAGIGLRRGKKRRRR